MKKYDPATAASLSLWEWRNGILCGSIAVDGPLEATSLTFLPPPTTLSTSFSAAVKKELLSKGGEIVLGGGGGNATLSSWKIDEEECVLTKTREADMESGETKITGLFGNSVFSCF